MIVHLVLNPGAHQSHRSSSSTPQPVAQPAPPIEPTRPNPGLDTPGAPSSTVPHNALENPQQNQLPFGQPFQAHVPQPNPFPQMQQALAIMNQQIAAQMAALGAPTAAPAQFQGQPPILQHNPQIPHPPQLPNQPPLFQHNLHPAQPHHHPHNHVTHNQAPPPQPSTRLGPQLNGSPHMTPQQALQQHTAQQSVLRHQQQFGAADSNQGPPTTAAPRSNSAPPPGLGNTNTVIRETYGPNGERHQSIVSSGTFQLNRGVQVPHAGLRHRGAPRPSATTPGTPTPGTPGTNNQFPSQRVNPQEQGTPHPSPTDLRIQLIQSHMLSMELAMNLGTVPPPESVQEQIRTLLQSVAPTISQQQYQQLEMRRSLLFERASAMRRNQDAQMQRVAEQIASQRTGQRSEDSTVYLLSSANGPQALLISPLGNYTAPWPIPTIPQAPPIGLPNPPVINAPLNGLIRAQQAQINAIQLAQAHPDGHQQVADGIQLLPNPQQLQPHPLAPGQHLAQQNGQVPNPARDIVRILIPLGGHLWLLVRLFGFVYFFTHGASWQRTIFLSSVATLLFIAQIGLFQPLLQTLWGPIRRHVEALLPLAGNEPPRRDNAPAENNGDAEGVQRRNQEPTPQQAAERLLREREAQDGNFLRQSLRRMERAVALFVASLVPGVGERHIAAREAAEAARQQQEREREERARIEEEERLRKEEEEREKRGEEDRANGMANAATRPLDESTRRLDEPEGSRNHIVEPSTVAG